MKLFVESYGYYMKIKNELSTFIDVYKSDDESELLVVENDSIIKNLVVLKFRDFEIKVNADELIAAIQNIKNTGRLY